MSTDLTRIGEKAAKDSKCRFNALMHHIYDIDNLKSCYKRIENNKAVGIDKITKEEYGKDLESNLNKVNEELKRGSFKPGQIRQVEIPKAGTAKMRKLGISNLEDKIVQKSVKETLEQIYEVDFLESSYGYRPGRSQHKALDELGKAIQQRKMNYIVTADIKCFFDTVNHDWMIKFLEHRIADKRIIRLITKMMRAKTVLENGLIKANREGTAQGSILSPLLSNVYLHYSLDLWYELTYKKSCSGESFYIRYADDFVICFQYKSEAERFAKEASERLAKFDLTIEEDKTKIIEFGRYAGANAGTFDFLGFTHYCSKTKHGIFKLKRKTSIMKFRNKLKELNIWLKKVRSWLRTDDILKRSIQIANGYLNYYAITDNTPMCANFMYQFRKLLFKWLNRQSQRKSYTWPHFDQIMKWYGWPSVKRRVKLCPFSKI